MADYSITINNQLNLLGASPYSVWGVMRWGVGKWGVTEDLVTSTLKVLSNALSNTSTVVFTPLRVLTNSIAFSGDMISEGLFDGSGYSYVFRGNVTEGEDRVDTTYTEATDAGTSYSSSSTSTTTWSPA